MSDFEQRRTVGVELAKRLFAGSTTSNPMPHAFRDRTMAELFGGVWQGAELALEERSLLTCTVLVALSREAEQRLHFLGAKNLGVSRDKMEAMITHVAYYAGWPCAVSAFRVMREVWGSE